MKPGCDRLAASFLFQAALSSILSAAAHGSLLQSPDYPRRDHGCSVVVSAGVGVVDVHGVQDATIEWQLHRVSGPAEVRFRMKTAVNGEEGEYLVYWIADGRPMFRSFRRIPFHADGEWHDYRMPLSGSGEVTGIRFSWGRQPHRVEIADVEVVPVTSDLPAEVEGTRKSLPASKKAAAGSLSCELNCTSQVFTIRDDVTGRTWTSEPMSSWLRLYGVERAAHNELQLKLFDLHARVALTAGVEVTEHRAVRFTIDSSDARATVDAAANYPPRFTTDMDRGQLVFCDRSCGVLLSQNDPTFANWPLRVYGNSHCLDMPWIGLFDDDRRDGVMLIVETPTDAEVALVADAKGRHWPEVNWLSSRGGLGTRRTASLCFTESGGYVRFAQLYRERLQQAGKLKTLREKAAAKPAVELLRGAAFLWGADAAGHMLDELPSLGITRAVINGCKDAQTIKQLNEQGYLTGSYDSYTDILAGEVGFQRDDVGASAIRSRPGGPPKHGWRLESGEQMYWRSSAAWSAAEKAYVPAELTKLPYKARFIDVAAAAELLEDYHPQHSMSRSDDLANRRALFRRFNERGLVLGTEHGNDWVVDQMDYFEGAMSGPFWWSSWPAGYLKRPTREQLSPEYLKFGMGYAHRIPLWELVYHDCAVSTWYWGDTAGMLYQSAPDLADRKDLFNILYGTPPLIWLDGRDYRYPADIQRMLRTYHDTCPLHAVVAFEELVDHEFLNEDRSLQRTRFGDGTVAVVNFSDEPRSYDNGDGSLTLSPRGYFVRGPGIRQSRLWINGAPQTVLVKNGLLTVEGDGATYVEGIRCKGRVTLFQVNESRWDVLVHADADVDLVVRTVTGWNALTSVSVHSVLKAGELGGPASEVDHRGSVRLSPALPSEQFSIVRNN